MEVRHGDGVEKRVTVSTWLVLGAEIQLLQVSTLRPRLFQSQYDMKQCLLKRDQGT